MVEQPIRAVPGGRTRCVGAAFTPLHTTDSQMPFGVPASARVLGVPAQPADEGDPLVDTWSLLARIAEEDPDLRAPLRRVRASASASGTSSGPPCPPPRAPLLHPHAPPRRRGRDGRAAPVVRPRAPRGSCGSWRTTCSSRTTTARSTDGSPSRARRASSCVCSCGSRRPGRPRRRSPGAPVEDTPPRSGCVGGSRWSSSSCGGRPGILAARERIGRCSTGGARRPGGGGARPRGAGANPGCAIVRTVLRCTPSAPPSHVLRRPPVPSRSSPCSSRAPSPPRSSSWPAGTRRTPVGTRPARRLRLVAVFVVAPATATQQVDAAGVGNTTPIGRRSRQLQLLLDASTASARSTSRLGYEGSTTAPRSPTARWRRRTTCAAAHRRIGCATSTTS